MRFLTSLILSVFLTAPAFAQDGKIVEPKPPVKPPVKAPAFKTVAPATVKAGDHIVVDATSAKGKIEFLFDPAAFPKERATLLGKVLVLSTPINGTYTVSVVSYDDGVTEKLAVKVTGGIDPPPGPKPPDPPIPSDPIAALSAKVDALIATVGKLDARVKTLEQNPPTPVPVDAFQKAVNEAYAADGKPAAAAAKLAAVYRQSDATVNNPSLTRASDVLSTMHRAAQSLIGDQLPKVRRVLADELNANLGKTDKTLDGPSRAMIAVQFLRMQAALESLK